MNGRDEQNKPILIPNEDAKLVKYIFQEISKGRTQAELRAELDRKGLR
jgi:hypothetical protein